MKQGDLYCWARQMEFDLVPDQIAVSLDHTWITSYPNPGPPGGFTLPIPPSSNYWYCWGVFHSAGDSQENPKPYQQFLGPVSGNLEEANCICEPNVQTDPNPEKASWSHAYLGKIYGQHGVCHQAANRILWTGGVEGNGQRVTVKGVQGWQLSWFVYGPYGYKLTPDKWPLSQCDQGKSKPLDSEIERSLDPDLHEMISTQLGADFPPNRRNELLSLRKSMWEDKDKLDHLLNQSSLQAVEYANRINQLLAGALREAHDSILSHAEFNAMFGVEYRTGLLPLVVDPRMAKVYALPADSAKRAKASS